MRWLPLRFSALVCMAMFVTSLSLAYAQDIGEPPSPPSSSPIAIDGLEILLGGAAPENGNAGALIGVLLSPLKELSGTEIFKPLRSKPPTLGTSGTIWSLLVTLEIDIASGGDENANHIIAKFQGHFLAVGYEPSNDGGLTIDSKGFFNVFPIAGGFETDQNFRKLNALVEIGWTPFNTNPWFKYNDNLYKLGVNPRFGLFLQGGYKFELDDNPDNMPTGNAQDESKEDPDSNILRIKADLRGRFDLYKGTNGVGLSLQPSAIAWYDIANSEFYHQFRVSVEAKISNELSWFTSYEHGSGAPNFNEGDQFSTGLKITF